MLTNGENFGHYRVYSAIGAGGMGEIYRAHDTRLKRDVAIKILPAQWTKNASAVERFTREAQAVSALNHPNILTIYDVGEYGDVQFIATEFVEGKTLRQRLETSALDVLETLDVAIQISDALAAAHGAGIVHRDIKPENIMLRADGYVKILDFGIAKLTEYSPQVAVSDAATLIRNSTLPGMVLGTAVYMSPEQARGLDVDPRSDIFSVGSVIYEMLAGQPPFGGETISDIIASILLLTPKPISEFVKDIPSELEWSLNKTLGKDREERYQTIKSLADDLKRLRQRLEFEKHLERANKSEKISGAGNFTGSDHSTLIFSGEHKIKTAVRRSRAAIDSLAVLPLVNENGERNTEYLADGITEFIINSLSKVSKLRVVPRSTVFRYKGSEADVPKIGRELDVKAVLVGRVMQIGNSLIVKTELVDVANESQIWGEQYRRRMTDIFKLQGELAEDISEKLKLKLSGKKKQQIKKSYTDNTKAYQHYLKGRYFVTANRTEEWIKKGIEYFKKAIKLDPDYALAYSGIAEAYGFLASSTGGWQPRKAFPKAEAAASKALEIDNTLGEAHCSLGFSRLLYDWDFAAAESEFKQAIKLSPNHANAYDGYGFYLKAIGRHKEAIEKGKKVQQLDPLSPFAYISLSYAYYFARDYKKAIDEGGKALEIDKYSAFAYRNIGLAYLQQGKFETAIETLNKAVTFSNGAQPFETYLGCAYALAGKNSEALEILSNFEKVAQENYVSAHNFAVIYAGLNDFDNTFKWLEKAYKERSGFVPFLKVEPLFDNFRNDSRFQKLLQKIGLTK